MDLESLQNVLARCKRIKTRMNSKSGIGMEWAVQISNTEICEYIVNGIKPPVEFNDDIEITFVWLWSFKDYVKQYSISKQLPPSWVEAEVNKNEALCIIADIANRAKHGNLTTSRSKKFPKLGNLKYEFPHGSIDKICFYANKVEANVSKPHQAILSMNVFDGNGNTLGDAFQLIDDGLQTWENIVIELDEKVS